MVAQGDKISVLMVCLGICRSPMAEAVLKHQITQRSSLKGRLTIEVDSAGTGAYHEGDEADERTIATCKKHKIPISCIARKVTKHDYDQFDYILAMDDANLQSLLNRRPPNSKAVIAMFGSYDPDLRPGGRAKPIADPYYGGPSGFEKSFEQCTKYAQGFLDHLERELAKRD